MQSLEQRIVKVLQWVLGTGFIIIGALLLHNDNFLLGTLYLTWGVIVIPVLKLPYGFRTIVILLGAFFL